MRRFIQLNNTIHLWGLILLLILGLSLFLGYEETGRLKAMILNSFDARKQVNIQDVKIKYDIGNPSFFAAIVEYEENWREDLYVGRMDRGMIKWLDIKDPPTEQSILSARFIKLEGIPGPVLEIYGATHMGNGNIYLYRVDGNELSKIFSAVAVDYYKNNIWRPGGYPEYGDYSTCSEVYKNGKLSAYYKDLNGDNISDVVLDGKAEVICEEVESYNPFKSKEVKVTELPIRQTFILQD